MNADGGSVPFRVQSMAILFRSANHHVPMHHAPSVVMAPATLRGAAWPALWMLLACALFAAQAGLVKRGLRNFGVVELVFYRSLVALLLTLAFARLRHLPLATRAMRKQLQLGAVGAVSLMLYFYAIAHLPLGTATALNYTAPMFLWLLMWLAESRRANRMCFAAVLLGFLGVWLLLKPSLAGGASMALVLGLLSGATGGVAYLLLSRLGAAGEPVWVTSWYFSLVGCLLGGAATWGLGPSAIGWNDAALLASIGLLAMLGQLALGAAYARGSPLVAATLSYSAVVFSVGVGAVFWNDGLEPAAMAAIALVVLSGLTGVIASPARPSVPQRHTED